jgi:hypothetical protein
MSKEYPIKKIDSVTNITIEYSYMSELCYLTATEWANGEGWTINIQKKGDDVTFQFHHSDYSALLLAIETLNIKNMG